MRKLWYIYFLGTFQVFALNNGAFQQFENEYSIGYGISSGTLVNGVQDTSSFNLQLLNLEVERLFDIGIWLDSNFSVVTNYKQPNLGYLNGGSGSGQPYGQNPFMYSFINKLGYAFQVVGQHLQLIPYAMFGTNANWATSTVLANGGASLANDSFLTSGVGARLAYRINRSILLYADGIYTYNWDNSGAIKSIQAAPSFYGKSYAATNYTFTSTIGAKFNIVKNLQLGISSFWNNYQPQSNISGLVYTATNTYGALVSVGLTY